jgi:lysozyme
LRKIIGPDVSFYQDDPGTPNGINFRRMNNIVDFVIIRAGQNLWTDPDFKENWQAAKAENLPRGSYWFYDSRADPKQQANLWVSLLKGDMGELPLFADLEEVYKGEFAGWENWKKFLERLRSLVGQKEIGIYTAYYYWRENAPTNTADLEYFHQYPLWIANYGVEAPLVPKPWTTNEWLLWQFTAMGNGILYGVESAEIDLNYFNGDEQAFANRFNVPVPPEPTPPDTNGKEYIVNAGALYVRQGPSTDSKVLGYLQRNQIVEALDHNEDGTWLFIKRASDGLLGWSFITYLVPVTDPTTPGTEQPPGEPPTPDPDGNLPRYRVTASALYVREEADAKAKIVGYLVRDDIVVELDANSEKSWRRIRRIRDKLTGWCSSKYLLLISAPSPDGPPEEPPETTGVRYKVTASRLNVREGPDTSYKYLGYVQLNEIVDEIEANTDKSWIKILRADGLVGWSSARYLDQIITPTPDDGTGTKYLITAGALYMREGPSTSYRSIGYVSRNDIVSAIGANADQSWRQIRRADGLVGWASANYMELVQPTSHHV